jgi:ABC-2 type transport system ATP-binding protein
MLRFTGVAKSYGMVPAVKALDFVARRGEVLGYLGPNGSGKSTTVKMAVALLEPTRGVISFDEKDIRADLIRYRRSIGYVPESPELYLYLTGSEYLELVGGLRGIPQRVLQEKIDKFLDLLELAEDRYAPMSAYSKGMRQKILISAALLHDPEVVVFDEPSSGLDAGSVLLLRELVRALAAQGKVVLYSSHDLGEVEDLCSRVVILRAGSIVTQGSVDSLRDLLHKPSLERIFADLVLTRDVQRAAADLVSAMKL